MLEEENIDQLKMTDWQNAIYRHSTRIDPSFPLVDFRLKLSTMGINRKYFHLYSACPCPRCLAWSYLCVYILLSPRYLSRCTIEHGSQHDPLHLCHREQSDSQRTPSPARLGPAVDSVQQSSTYRPTCQDASSALTGQTREKAWTGWRQIFPKWLSHIAGRYFWYFHAGIRN